MHSGMRIMCRRTLFALALLSVLGSCTGPTTSTRTVEVLGCPTKVRTVELGRRKSGEPVLFLMGGGGGGPLESWGDFIEMISSMAPVVTYHRPGIGGSPFDGVDPTPQRVAEHAHALLAALEIPPPYILVGWSWGGPLIRYYAGAYPGEVVGMVYLDPSDMTATPVENIGAATDEEARTRAEELDEAIRRGGG